MPEIAHETVAWDVDDDGMAWCVEGPWWSLPAVVERTADTELATFETPAGHQDRRHTTIVLGRSEASIRRPPAEVLAAWARHELFLDPAARHAIDPDGIPGVEPAYGVRAIPLRTPTLPPATHTNCYVVGRENGLVVDPGAPYDKEIDRLVDALERWQGRFGPLAAIFCTHHHGDHVGSVTRLRKRTGLPVLAHPITADLVPFDVDRHVEDGDRPHPDWEAVFTPGHAPGHLCLHNADSGLVVAGDMIASAGTIIVDPTEGDMGEYLDSIARLKALNPRGLLPAHGAFIDRPIERLDYYRDHRLWREGRIFDALESAPLPLAEVTKRAYTDVPTALLVLAARSALSHLRKLRDDGRAVERGGDWSLPR